MPHTTGPKRDKIVSQDQFHLIWASKEHNPSVRAHLEMSLYTQGIHREIIYMYIHPVFLHQVLIPQLKISSFKKYLKFPENIFHHMKSIYFLISNDFMISNFTLI